jgi:hypothetical protein
LPLKPAQIGIGRAVLDEVARLLGEALVSDFLKERRADSDATVDSPRGFNRRELLRDCYRLKGTEKCLKLVPASRDGSIKLLSRAIVGRFSRQQVAERE